MKKCWLGVLLVGAVCVLSMSARAGEGGAKPARVQQSVKDAPVMQRVAVFGVGVSFTDSVVYQTELQVLDSAWIRPGHKFLEDRSLYSLQLQYFMESQGVKNSICTVLFDKNPRRLQRKWNKVNKRHSQQPAQHFRVVKLGEFRFKAEEYRPVMIGDETE